MKRKEKKLFDRREDDLKVIFQTNTKQATLADFPPPLDAVCPYCGEVVELNERGLIPMTHLESQKCKANRKTT